ncbi:MAG: AIR carboxylase family protein [Clostridia bacterium]|nr:AIR carboxylase family protein [Clostridia bacterium]
MPVATVAIDGGGNAALLAAQMLAIEDEALAERIAAKRASDAKKVLEKNAAVEAEFNK